MDYGFHQLSLQSWKLIDNEEDWCISLTIDNHTSSEIVFGLFSPSLFKGDCMRKGRIHRLELDPGRIVINNENWDLWAKLCVSPLCQLLCRATSVKETCWILLNGKMVKEEVCKPTSHQSKVGLWTAEIILVNQMDSDTQVQLSKSSLFSQKPKEEENMNESCQEIIS